MRANTFTSLESLQQFLDLAVAKPQGIDLGPFTEGVAIRLRMRLYQMRRKAQKENQRNYGGKLPDGTVPDPEAWRRAAYSVYDSLNFVLFAVEGAPHLCSLHIGAQTAFDFEVRDCSTGKLIHFHDPIVRQEPFSAPPSTPHEKA